MSRGILSWLQRYKIIENEIEVNLEYQDGSYILIFYRIFGGEKEKIENPSELFKHQFFWETDREKHVLSTASYQIITALSSANPIELENGTLKAKFSEKFFKYLTSNKNVFETDTSKNNRKIHIEIQEIVKKIKSLKYFDINKLTRTQFKDEIKKELLLKHDYILSKTENILISLNYLKIYYNITNIDDIQELLTLKISKYQTHKIEIKKYHDLEINRTNINDIRTELMDKTYDFVYSNIDIILIHEKHFNKITESITIRKNQTHLLTITHTNPSINEIEKINSKTSLIEKEVSVGFFILEKTFGLNLPPNLPETTQMMMSPLLFPSKYYIEIDPGVYRIISQKQTNSISVDNDYRNKTNDLQEQRARDAKEKTQTIDSKIRISKPYPHNNTIRENKKEPIRSKNTVKKPIRKKPVKRIAQIESAGPKYPASIKPTPKTTNRNDANMDRNINQGKLKNKRIVQLIKLIQDDDDAIYIKARMEINHRGWPVADYIVYSFYYDKNPKEGRLIEVFGDVGTLKHLDFLNKVENNSDPAIADLAKKSAARIRTRNR